MTELHVVAHQFSRAATVLERILAVVLAVLVAALVVTVWIQVFGRLVLNDAPLWTVDYATLLLVWSTFVGAAVALRKGDHFVIDVAGEGHPHWQRFAAVASAAVVILVLAALVIYGAQYASASASRLTGMTEISMAYYIAALPIGAGLGLLFAVEQAVTSIAGTREVGAKAGGVDV